MDSSHNDFLLFLVSDGQQGATPDWYETVEIARYLGLTPQEVEAMPDYWRGRILLTMQIEREAKSQIELSEQRGWFNELSRILRDNIKPPQKGNFAREIFQGLRDLLVWEAEYGEDYFANIRLRRKKRKSALEAFTQTEEFKEMSARLDRRFQDSEQTPMNEQKTGSN